MIPNTHPREKTEPKPGLFRIWLAAIRPRTLAAGIAPILVGAGLAQSQGHFLLLPCIAALMGALLLQIASNLSNDVADHLRGADTDERLGPARAAQKGWLTHKQLILGTLFVLIAASVVGIYLIQAGGWPILLIGLMGMAGAVLYTAGPLPLGYLGLGEVLVFAFFGLAAVSGTYLVQGNTLTPEVWVAAMPIGLLASAILVVNNLRDRHTDKSVGKRTLAVRFGGKWARKEYRFFIVSAYLIPTLWVVLGHGSWGWLLPLLSAPLALKAVLAISHLDGRALNPWLGKTALLELIFALLLAIGVML